jgi:hypothetical protein
MKTRGTKVSKKKRLLSTTARQVLVYFLWVSCMLLVSLPLVPNISLMYLMCVSTDVVD